MGVSIRVRSRERTIRRIVFCGQRSLGFNPRSLSRANDRRHRWSAVPKDQFQSAFALASERLESFSLKQHQYLFQSAFALASERSTNVNSAVGNECSFNPRSLSRANDLPVLRTYTEVGKFQSAFALASERWNRIAISGAAIVFQSAFALASER